MRARGVGVFAIVLFSAVAGGGCGSGDGGAGTRAACYPTCLSKIVRRCPLTSGCQVDLEAFSSSDNPGESDGIAVCFSSGEKEREAENLAKNHHDRIYVKAADGSECYAAEGLIAGSQQYWDIWVRGTLAAHLDADYSGSTPSITVTCPGDAPVRVGAGDVCERMPWDNVVSCTQATDLCTFGAPTTPPIYIEPDGSNTCDPTPCTHPPENQCEVALGGGTQVTRYPSQGTCNSAGCVYAPMNESCHYGCYELACIGALKGISNVTATVKTTGQAIDFTMSGGGANASPDSPTIITARTSPRGATETVRMVYTVNNVQMDVGLTPDPATPASQSDYEVWTLEIPVQNTQSRLSFHLTAKGYGVTANSADPMGKDWIFTTN